jgi:hypothetical protein
MQYMHDKIQHVSRGVVYIDLQRIVLLPNAVRGNVSYALRQERGLRNLQGQLDERIHFEKVDETYYRSNAVFLTLDMQYDTSNLDSINSTWERIGDASTKFFRKFKRIGCKEYVDVLESHVNGGRHDHCVIILDRDLLFKKYTTKDGKIKYLPVDQAYQRQLQSLWAHCLGVRRDQCHCDVLGICDSKLRGYATKEAGKEACAERCLKRLMADKYDPSDDGEKLRKHDVQTVILHYMACKHSKRIIKVSRGLSYSIPKEGKPLTLEEAATSYGAPADVPCYPQGLIDQALSSNFEDDCKESDDQNDSYLLHYEKSELIAALGGADPQNWAGTLQYGSPLYEYFLRRLPYHEQQRYRHGHYATYQEYLRSKTP